MIQILLCVNYVPSLVPVDEADHVNRLLRKILLKMLVKSVVAPLVCQIHFNEFIVAVNELVIARFGWYLFLIWL